MILDSTLWFAGAAAEAVVVVLLARRRAWRTLPVFCLYSLWTLISDTGDYAVKSYFPSSYFTTYFVGAIIDSLLQFSVLVELAWSVLRPIRSSLPRKSLLVVAVVILIAAVAVWPFSGIHGLATLSPQLRYLVRGQQTVAILRIIFFLVLAGSSQLFSIGWRDRELQVATGLGFYSIVSVSVEVLQSHQGIAQYAHLNQAVIAGYICSLLYWIFSFATQEAKRREFTPQMQSLLLAVAGSARATRMAMTDSPPDRHKEPREP